MGKNHTKVKVKVLMAQLCPILWDPVDCSLPGFSIHGILWARELEWLAIPFSRGSSQLRDQTCIFCIAGRFFAAEPPGKPIRTIKALLKFKQQLKCPPPQLPPLLESSGG